MPEQQPPTEYRVHEVAEIFRVDSSTVRGWIKRKIVSAKRNGVTRILYIPAADVERLKAATVERTPGVFHGTQKQRAKPPEPTQQRAREPPATPGPTTIVEPPKPPEPANPSPKTPSPSSPPAPPPAPQAQKKRFDPLEW